MYFLEICNDIWDKVSKVIKKGFDREPVHKEKYIKTKIKSFEGKVNTNFYNGKVAKEGSGCICLSMVLMTLFLKWLKTIILKCF